MEDKQTEQKKEESKEEKDKLSVADGAILSLCNAYRKRFFVEFEINLTEEGIDVKVNATRPSKVESEVVHEQ